MIEKCIKQRFYIMLKQRPERDRMLDNLLKIRLAGPTTVITASAP